MKRMFGMMPSSEVEIEKHFDTGSGLVVLVQAGPNGWSIIYADSSAEFNDVTDDTQSNLNRAIAILMTHFSDITEVTKEPMPEICADWM